MQPTTSNSYVKMSNLWALPPIGDHFGSRAAELAGIVIRPDTQGHSLGSSLVESFIQEARPSRLIAFTRNPALLRAVGHACAVADVLAHQDPEATARNIPFASLEDDGNIYHLGRYAPHGLYGSFDPAHNSYNNQRLDQRCRYLTNQNNALAISVEIGK